MKIRLIVVGRDRNDPICQVADQYLGRVRHVMAVETLEIKEAPLRRHSSVDQVMLDEATRIEKVIGPRERLVVLDRKGRSLSSEQLADRLEDAQNRGVAALTFVIGGPSGLHSRLVERASEAWSLSALTLPHRVARLVICEQLYRACSILRGEPYHK